MECKGNGNKGEIIFHITREDIQKVLDENKEICTNLTKPEAEIIEEIIDSLQNTLDWKDTAEAICYLYMEG